MLDYLTRSSRGIAASSHSSSRATNTTGELQQATIIPEHPPINAHVTMFSSTRSWFRRNRTPLAITAAAVGATYLAGSYIVTKITEARQRSAEDRLAKENLRRRFEQNQEDCTYTVLALLPTIRDEVMGGGQLPVEQITEELQRERQERLRRLGGSAAAGSKGGASTELPSVPASVVGGGEGGGDARSMSSGSFVHASQMGASSLDTPPSRPKKSKAQLWQEMKLNSITRALSLIYTLSLLTLLTRIQLNLLGRRTYLSSVVALATPPASNLQGSKISLENNDDDNYDNVYGNDFETNRKYLTFSWWLLHRGSKLVVERVMQAVKEVFGPVDIREDISLERLAELILHVRRKVEGETEEERRKMRWLPFLLPPPEEEGDVVRQSTMPSEHSDGSPSPEAREGDPLVTAANATAISPSLRRLLDETADLIDSPTFSHVLTHLLDAAYSHLVDYRIAFEAFKTSTPAYPTPPQGNLEPSYLSVSPEPGVTEVLDIKCKLAHILPVFCKQAHVIAAGSGDLVDAVAEQTGAGLGNEYLGAIDRVGDLEAFAAVIYSSNFEFEGGEEKGRVPEVRMEDSLISGFESRSPTIDAEDEGLESVIEVEPNVAVDSTFPEGLHMEGNEATVSDTAEALAVSTPDEGALESAWKKALAAEDGKTAAET